MLLYFIHANNPEKTQYNVEEVQGELKEYLSRRIAKQEPQEDKLTYLIESINDRTIENEYQLIKHCIAIGAIDVLQRFSYILTKMLKRKVDKEYQ